MLNVFLGRKTASHSANMEKELRDQIRLDCKRLIREAKTLIKRSREILKYDLARQRSEGLPTPKRKSKAARASSRQNSRV
jgi:hypothetical protein